MQLDKDKLYYLCHPYTTYGTMEENKEDSIKIEKELTEKHRINILNPLRLISDDDNDIAMTRCLNLLAACESIILCKHWNMSTGCNLEVEFSVNRHKDILVLEDLL